MPVYSPARVDLDLGPIDPASALEAWMKLEGADKGFLLENVGEGRVRIGVGPFEVLRITKGRAYLEKNGKKRPLSGDPVTAAGKWVSGFKVKGEVKPFSNGIVGWLGYELVRFLETKIKTKELGDEGVLMAFPAMVLISKKKVTLWTLRGDGKRLARRLEGVWRGLPKGEIRKAESVGAPEGTMGKSAFLNAVKRIKSHIRAGDIFQCVISERFSVRNEESPIDLYRRLRAVSPSPYNFYFRDGEKSYLGASPEMLVKVEGGRVETCPIAGTRPRGKGAHDKRLEKALLASPKERAEHLMLVDLGRNDLGKVCAPGTVEVSSFMKVRRFSHVMHLVSTVEGRIEKGKTAWDALKACFPAGTVSGAPKVRAMEIISELETTPRGFYSGAFLQHDFQGNLDSCIALRSVQKKGGRAVFRAGAGIVADSRPEAEYQEVRNKLAAARRALGAA